MEAKRGLLDNARRHSAIARRILRPRQIRFLRPSAAILTWQSAFFSASLSAHKPSANQATESAERSGVAKIRRAVLSNLASLYCEMGQFDRAKQYFESALAASEINVTHSSAIHDGMARVRLLQGRLDECAKLLDRVECSIQSDDDRTLYGYRYAALTRAQLLRDQGRVTDAIVQITSVPPSQPHTGDALLLSKAELTRAALLLSLGRISESLAALRDGRTGARR